MNISIEGLRYAETIFPAPPVWRPSYFKNWDWKPS